MCLWVYSVCVPVCASYQCHSRYENYAEANSCVGQWPTHELWWYLSIIKLQWQDTRCVRPNGAVCTHLAPYSWEHWNLPLPLSFDNLDYKKKQTWRQLKTRRKKSALFYIHIELRTKKKCPLYFGTFLLGTTILSWLVNKVKEVKKKKKLQYIVCLFWNIKIGRCKMKISFSLCRMFCCGL